MSNSRSRLGKGGRHPSLAYTSPFEDSQTVFGTNATPDFLIQRVRSYSWEASFKQLAWIAAKVSHYGQDSEEVRRLTIDPLALLTGDSRATAIVESARRAVATRRSQMRIAHEQSLSLVQHLVLLEGGDGSEIPSEAELSMWLACAGSFLSGWQHEDGAAVEADSLTVTLSQILRFNNGSDAARNLVRSSLLFARPPRTGPLSDKTAWEKLLLEAFGVPYDEFFEAVLGPLYLFSQMWGDETTGQATPVVNMTNFLRETKVPPDTFISLMKVISADRETLRDVIRKRLKGGLPHAPTALLYQPFVKLPDDIYVAASPWAIQHQVRFAPWARLMVAAKQVSKKRSPDEWFRAFGQQLESWCRDMALAAQGSRFCKATFHMPENPGGDDEVEDVVLIEGRAVVLFSVKSRVMEAKAAREAVSIATTMDWYRDYFFEQKGDDFRGGAIRQLDSRIRMIRDGTFENQGISRAARILPVIVTYDALGESDQLYRWLASECKKQGVLQGQDIGPLTLADVDDFEDLMARAADGKSVVKLLRRREGPDEHRRLDQIISEHSLPRGRRRLEVFDGEFKALHKRIVRRLFDKEVSDIPSP